MANFIVKGKVTLDDTPHGSVVVISTAELPPTVLGVVNSLSSTGLYSFTTTYDKPVMIHTMQNYGDAWGASKPKEIDDVVHPTTPNGYIYKVLQAGNTGQSEPAWTAEANASINDGSVIYESIRLLQPEIEGYVTPTPII